MTVGVGMLGIRIRGTMTPIAATIRPASPEKALTMELATALALPATPADQLPMAEARLPAFFMALLASPEKAVAMEFAVARARPGMAETQLPNRADRLPALEMILPDSPEKALETEVAVDRARPGSPATQLPNRPARLPAPLMILFAKPRNGAAAAVAAVLARPGIPANQVANRPPRLPSAVVICPGSRAKMSLILFAASWGRLVRPAQAELAEAWILAHNPLKKAPIPFQISWILAFASLARCVNRPQAFWAPVTDPTPSGLEAGGDG